MYTFNNNYLLILTGMNDMSNDVQTSPLLLSVIYNQPDCLEVLLQREFDVNTTGLGGNTALHIAIERDLYPCAQIIFRSHTQYNLQIKNNEGLTPFQSAYNSNIWRISDKKLVGNKKEHEKDELEQFTQYCMKYACLLKSCAESSTPPLPTVSKSGNINIGDKIILQNVKSNDRYELQFI